ncbi:similar to Kazachstania africana KAFR_0E02170 hypothetical protein [Maudiozyma saulgeensis]|uniref:PEX18/PEX21 C-terminal domain-containing protein n=1 Tax=Maudiozyma saulgeensis TaxID=1789683 RepID=A0A1X7R5J8_9SACH|nr:similar to Kazachstania africana KAFR_0E02170 hypothetical protein [Kazachstania saulgeensis]
MNSDCSTNVLYKLADKTQLLPLQNKLNRANDTLRQTKHSQYNNQFPQETQFPGSSSSAVSNGNTIVGSSLQDIPTDNTLGWRDEFLQNQTIPLQKTIPKFDRLLTNLEVDSSLRFGDNNLGPAQTASILHSAAPNNYTTTNNLKYQTYDYYNIDHEIQQKIQMEPRNMMCPPDALQDEFEELEKELEDLDLDAVMTTTSTTLSDSQENCLIDERQLFRDTATELYTLTVDNPKYISNGTQSKMVNSKFMNMMKMISNGSVNLNNTQTELCSTTSKEPMGNKYINIPENIYN